jgi:hypothetical protein
MYWEIVKVLQYYHIDKPFELGLKVHTQVLPASFDVTNIDLCTAKVMRLFKYTKVPGIVKKQLVIDILNLILTCPEKKKHTSKINLEWVKNFAPAIIDELVNAAPSRYKPWGKCASRLLYRLMCPMKKSKTNTQYQRPKKTIKRGV